MQTNHSELDVVQSTVGNSPSDAPAAAPTVLGLADLAKVSGGAPQGSWAIPSFANYLAPQGSW